MSEVNKVLQQRYEIKSLLGQGGMGAIFEGVDLKLGGSRVAIKQALLTSDSARRAFEREAMLLAKLSHPGLPKIRDYFAEGNEYYFVMEYIEGEDLEQKISRQKHPFVVETVERWIIQLLDVLIYIHGQNPPVTHRDIKPANVKITPFGGVMLIDFGLARGTSGGATSMVAYTPAYAPLEQIRGEGTDHRSDIYALGATVYRLLTGEMPINVLQRLESRALNGTDPQKRINEVNAQVSEAFSEVFEKAMSLDRKLRFQSAREMLETFYQAIKSGVSSNSATVEITSRKALGNTVEVDPPTIPLTSVINSIEQKPTEISSVSPVTLAPEPVETMYKPTEFQTLEEEIVEDKKSSPEFLGISAKTQTKKSDKEFINLSNSQALNAPANFEASTTARKPASNVSRGMIGSVAGIVAMLTLAVLGFSFWGAEPLPEQQISAPAINNKPSSQTAVENVPPPHVAPPLTSVPEASVVNKQIISAKTPIAKEVVDDSIQSPQKSPTVNQGQEINRGASKQTDRKISIRTTENPKTAERPVTNNKKSNPPGKSSKRALEEKMRANDDPY